MWPGKFDYQRASSVEEALQLLTSNEDSKLLAGGHSLLPAMKLRLSEPPMLIDIGHISGLKSISNSGGTIKIGALTTHAEIAASADVQQHCAPLAQATGNVGDPQVRNFGTLGGNIAHADPASDPPIVLVASDATIHVQGQNGKRSIQASNFFIDLFMTDLQPGEIITSIEIPSLQGKKGAYLKLAHPASRYAVVGVCVILTMNGNICQDARVAIGGATAMAMRSPGAEAALNGSNLDAAALNAAAAAIQTDIADVLMDDISFPQDYRQAMAGVYLKRAVKAALS